MNTKQHINRTDTVPLLELGDNRPSRRRRSSVVDSVEKFLGRRRSSIGQFFERSRESLIGRVFGHAAEETHESDEWIEMQRRLRQVKDKLDQRSTQQGRARVRCVDEPDDHDIPYELMGQVLVLSLLAVLFLFAWIADLEGIGPARV